MPNMPDAEPICLHHEEEFGCDAPYYVTLNPDYILHSILYRHNCCVSNILASYTHTLSIACNIPPVSHHLFISNPSICCFIL